MPTFIDESGDPGTGAGSSPFFRLCAIYFETIDQATSCQDAILDFKKNVLHKPNNFEFKSSKGRPEQHEAFFEAVADQSFYVVVSSVDKSGLSPDECSKEIVIRLAVRGLVETLNDYYLIAEATKGSPLNERVLMDRHSDPVYFGLVREGFLSLKSPRAPGAALVKSIKDGKSVTEPLIQLADMTCGAVARSHTGHLGCRNLFSKKMIGDVILPGVQKK